MIQNIDLRQNMDTKECIDYVRFRRKGTSYGPKICGQHILPLVMDREGEIDEESRLAFSSENGVIEVNIFVSKEPLKDWEKLDLKIVFTAYRSKLNRHVFVVKYWIS